MVNKDEYIILWYSKEISCGVCFAMASLQLLERSWRLCARGAGWRSYYPAAECRVQTDVDAPVKVVQYADAGRSNDGELSSLAADVQLLRLERPPPRVLQDAPVDGKLEIGADLDVERRMLDLNAARAAHLGSSEALCDRVENGEMAFCASRWLQTMIGLPTVMRKSVHLTSTDLDMRGMNEWMNK